ncbi:hypothetical protein EJ05DRAFT_307093 [Pseudovirgaria hyperparasitica]|uniref:Uncharacterized protein n=1 Tax=Pseudovirgaria hyperparasitica TaxID=470096 RepID=A0A6A6WCY1_9PEZI|nr:uncharacterized protein EJ05DRAFT_307093 [Pseudovirgaria hyperparasitica]KAF2759706.1 hypothetical protein EJ05DRAFT_307093 [Pseudovirgaria hyperparasitica]
MSNSNRDHKRASSLPGHDIKQSQISNEYVVPGRLLWLPKVKEGPKVTLKPLQSSPFLEDEDYGTPVVVCSRPAERPDSVHVHLVDLFQNHNLEDVFSRGRYALHHRLSYLPIFPSSPHPDHDKTEYLPSLELAHDQEIPGNVYINVRTVYSVDWRYLEPFAQTGCRLEHHALTTLLNRSRQLNGYLPGPQVEFTRARSVTLPTRARASTYKVSPVKAASYPVPEASQEKPVRGPRLSVSIPDQNMGYGTMLSDPGSQPERKIPQNEPDRLNECKSVLDSFVGTATKWTGSLLSTACWRRTRKWHPKDDVGDYQKLESAY